MSNHGISVPLRGLRDNALPVFSGVVRVFLAAPVFWIFAVAMLWWGFSEPVLAFIVFALVEAFAFYASRRGGWMRVFLFVRPVRRHKVDLSGITIVDRAHRKELKWFCDQWDPACEWAGLGVDDRDAKGLLIRVYPRLLAITDHPLGFALEVQPVPGQPVETLVARASHLTSSYVGIPFVPEVVGGSLVRYVVQTHDPLEGTRVAEVPTAPTASTEGW